MKAFKLFFPLLFLISGVTLSANAQTVYVTKTGAKYHKSSCQYLKYSSLTIDLADAKKKGYEACKKCKPNSTVSKTKTAFGSGVTPSNPEDIKNATSKQCSSLTQSGNRCKRMTKSADGKCWQHQQ